MVKVVYGDSVVISISLLCSIYFIVAIVSMVRLYWLFTRVKTWIYQKFFFSLVILACAGRIPMLLVQLFVDPKALLTNRAFKVFDSLTSDLFISSFVLIIFAIAHIYFQHVGRISHQGTIKTERMLIVLLVILNIILVTTSIILGLKKTKTFLDLYIFDIVAFLVISFGLLIWSMKLLYYFRKRKELVIYSQIKTLFRVILACIFLHLLRIPLILILNFYEMEWFKKPWEDALYLFFYFFISELLAVCLVIFFLFEIPPKSGEFQEVEVETYPDERSLINSPHYSD